MKTEIILDCHISVRCILYLVRGSTIGLNVSSGCVFIGIIDTNTRGFIEFSKSYM